MTALANCADPPQVPRPPTSIRALIPAATEKCAVGHLSAASTFVPFSLIDGTVGYRCLEAAAAGLSEHSVSWSERPLLPIHQYE